MGAKSFRFFDFFLSMREKPLEAKLAKGGVPKMCLNCAYVADWFKKLVKNTGR